MNSIIEIKNFQKEYSNQLVRLEDITLTKRVNLLVGKNGSGKSTLLKAIAQLINYKGDIICEKKICLMNEIVNYPLDLELDTFLRYLNKISNNPSSEEEINKLLVSFNLNHKLKEKLHCLSKGMASKVNLVQCLMEKADIYLLDEPLSGLDKLGVECLINYIKQSDSTFVISTHLNSDFKEICEEVFYL